MAYEGRYTRVPEWEETDQLESWQSPTQVMFGASEIEGLFLRVEPQNFNGFRLLGYAYLLRNTEPGLQPVSIAQSEVIAGVGAALIPARAPAQQRGGRMIFLPRFGVGLYDIVEAGLCI